jgi:hypothetical protein
MHGNVNSSYELISIYLFFLLAEWGGGVAPILGPLGTSTTEWPIVPTPGDCDDGEFGGIKIGSGNRITRRKPAPAPLCPPQIPLDHTRAAAVGSQRLTAWVMARPQVFIYLWLYSPCGSWLLFQFLNLYTVGRTPWTGDEPVARPLPTHRKTQTLNKRTLTSADIRASSGIRAHDPSVSAREDSSCLRQRGHCNRHLKFSPAWNVNFNILVY